MNIQATEVNRTSRKKYYLGNHKASNKEKKKSEERRKHIKQILESDHFSATKGFSSDDDDDDFISRHLASRVSMRSSSGRLGGGKSPSINGRKGIRCTATPDAEHRRLSCRGDIPLSNSLLSNGKSNIDQGNSSSRHSRRVTETIDAAILTACPPPPPPPPQDDSIELSQISRKSSIKSNRRRSCRGDIVMDNLQLYDDTSDSLNSWSLGGSTITGGMSRNSGTSLPREGSDQVTSGPPTNIVPRRRLSSRGDIVMDRVNLSDQKVSTTEAPIPQAPRRIRSGQPPPTKSFPDREMDSNSDQTSTAIPRKSLSLGNTKKAPKFKRRLSVGLYRSRSDASERTEETASLSSHSYHSSPTYLRRASHLEVPQQQHSPSFQDTQSPKLSRAASEDSYDSMRSKDSKKSKSKSVFKKKNKDKKKKKKDKTENKDEQLHSVPHTSPVHDDQPPRATSLACERQDDGDSDGDNDYSTHSGVDAIFQLGVSGFSALEKLYDDYLTG
jgi:hypothetical protein